MTLGEADMPPVNRERVTRLVPSWNIVRCSKGNAYQKCNQTAVFFKYPAFQMPSKAPAAMDVCALHNTPTSFVPIATQYTYE